MGDRWMMVIVRDLAAGPLRLDTLRRWLPGVSAGALEARLAKMAEEGLIVRRRHRSLPPRVDLELTDRGRALVDVIAALARWELRTQWSRPHAEEWVDVAACFRLAPFLDKADGGDRSPAGELALEVDDAQDAYVFIRAAGRTSIEHRAAPDATARIAGSRDAWVQALSPEGDRTGVRIEGDERLVASFLDLFAAPAPGA